MQIGTFSGIHYLIVSILQEIQWIEEKKTSDGT
jgi:hypothetical protein